MTIKSFERSIIELSHNLVFKKAKLIDNEYRLSVAELNAADKLAFVSQFLNMNTNLDRYIQEYIDDACMDRMYAESEQLGGWDE
jgi:hypothetical protein